MKRKSRASMRGSMKKGAGAASDGDASRAPKMVTVAALFKQSLGELMTKVRGKKDRSMGKCFRK